MRFVAFAVLFLFSFFVAYGVCVFALLTWWGVARAGR